MLNHRLEDTLLRDMGVDPTQIDLEEETERGGPYFLPMSQEHLNSLGKRREMSLTFVYGDDDAPPRPGWDIAETDSLICEFKRELDQKVDAIDGELWEGSNWQPHWYALVHGSSLILPKFRFSQAVGQVPAAVEGKLVP